MEFIKDLLASPAVIGWVAIAAVSVYSYFKAKKPEIAKYEGLALAVFNRVENMVKPGNPNDVNKWGLFLSEFVKEFSSKTGKNPSANLMSEVQTLVELLVAKKNV